MYRPRPGVFLCILLAGAPVVAQVPPPAGTESVATDQFTGSGDLADVAPGLGEMIVSDSMQLMDEGGEFEKCPVIFVAWGKRRAEAQAEVDFQQTPFVDPATRVRPGQFIDPTVMLTGHTEFSGSQGHYTVDVRRYPSGELIKRIEGDAIDDEFLDEMPERIAREFLEEFCRKQRPPPPPEQARARSYEGDLRYTVKGSDQSVELSGKLVWEESSPGSNIFTTSGQLDATVTVEDCERFSGPVPVDGRLDLDVPADGRYAFTLGTPPDKPELSCNGVAIPYGILLNSPSCNGSPEDAPRIGAGPAGALTGSGACIEGATLVWSFVRKK